jgi:two-component system heavy metal sensor histidine kinase CusS
LQDRQAEALAQKRAQLQHLLAEAARDDDMGTLRHKLDDFFIGHEDLSLWLERPDGAVFYRSPAAPQAGGDARRLQFALPSPMSPTQSLTATLTLDIGDDAALLRRIGLTLLAAALAGALVISLGGFLLVRLGLRPLHQLVDQTRRLAADTLHRRLDGSSQPEELEPMITQFNQLLGRLEQSYERLEGFNADVAHELCTPLATLIGSTELALRKSRGADELREVLASNLEELQRVAGIVQDMLFLSQADRGATARRVPTSSLAVVARRVADYHEAAMADAEIGLEVCGDAAGAFDTALLQRALSNLIANATRYARRKTLVRLEIEAARAGEVRLCLVNLGDTIAPEHLPRLFDRFYRGDPSRSDANRNHGLGLSIVAAIARMHGGETLAKSSGGVTAIGLTLRAE